VPTDARNRASHSLLETRAVEKTRGSPGHSLARRASVEGATSVPRGQQAPRSGGGAAVRNDRAGRADASRADRATITARSRRWFSSPDNAQPSERTVQAPKDGGERTARVSEDGRVGPSSGSLSTITAPSPGHQTNDESGGTGSGASRVSVVRCDTTTPSAVAGRAAPQGRYAAQKSRPRIGLSAQSTRPCSALACAEAVAVRARVRPVRSWIGDQKQPVLHSTNDRASGGRAGGGAPE